MTNPIHNHLNMTVCKDAEEAITWALGAGEDFPTRPKGAGAYWWRGELQKRAELTWDGSRFVPIIEETKEFEIWLRTVCFQPPTPEALDLAKCAWDHQQTRVAELETELETWREGCVCTDKTRAENAGTIARYRAALEQIVQDLNQPGEPNHHFENCIQKIAHEALNP